MWISATCGPVPRSACRGSSRLIGNDVADPQIFAEYGVSVLRGVEGHGGAVRSADIHDELMAGSQADEAFRIDAEVCGLAPGSDALIRRAADLDCLPYVKGKRSVIEHQGDRAIVSNIADLTIAARHDVN